MKQLRIKDEKTGRIYRKRGLPKRNMFNIEIFGILSKSEIIAMMIDDYYDRKENTSMEYAIYSFNIVFFQLEEFYKMKKLNIDVIRRCVNRDYPDIYIYQNILNFCQVFSLNIYKNIEDAIGWMEEQRILYPDKSNRLLAKECLTKGIILGNLNYNSVKLENYFSKFHSIYHGKSVP